MAKHIPLTSGFMLTSIVGFFVSVFFVWKISVTWGFTFSFFFATTFIASVLSMGRIDREDKEALAELAIHEKKRKKPKKK